MIGARHQERGQVMGMGWGGDILEEEWASFYSDYLGGRHLLMKLAKQSLI